MHQLGMPSPVMPSPLFPPASRCQLQGQVMNVPVRQTNALAVVSLISGLLGWTLLPFLGSLVAIITGHMARSEIRRSPDTQEGDGMAVAGLVLGYLVIALTVLTILAVIVFFGGLAAILTFVGAGH